jgi:uncharacterized protein
MIRESTSQSRPNVDPAALLGVVLAAVLTLFLPEGAWGPFAAIVGAGLSLILLAYYRPDLNEYRLWTVILQALAAASIGGLCLMILAAWPIQELRYSRLGLEGGYCYEYAKGFFPTIYDSPAPGIAPVTQAVQNEANDNCVGEETSKRLGWVWATIALVIFYIYIVAWTRNQQRNRVARFVLMRDTDGKYHFSLVAPNGEAIAASESYESKASALKGIESVKHNTPTAEIDDQTNH